MDGKHFIHDGLEIYDPEQVADIEKNSYAEAMARLNRLLRDAELDAWLREKSGGRDERYYLACR